MPDATPIAGCRWAEPGGTAAAEAIAAFLASIGITLEARTVGDDSLLPGMAVSGTTIRIDPARQAFPGDLLHEAGHIAVADPDRRGALGEVGDDPGEEMAAIAWSVAAARAAGVPLEVLFHPAGYKGGSASLIEAFSGGLGFGVPLLAWWGLTSEAEFPAMVRWIR